MNIKGLNDIVVLCTNYGAVRDGNFDSPPVVTSSRGTDLCDKLINKLAARGLADAHPGFGTVFSNPPHPFSIGTAILLDALRCPF